MRLRLIVALWIHCVSGNRIVGWEQDDSWMFVWYNNGWERIIIYATKVARVLGAYYGLNT